MILSSTSRRTWTTICRGASKVRRTSLAIRSVSSACASISSIALYVLLSTPSCSKSLPVPTTGSHAGDEPTVVPYPPPPARVEVVPPPPPALKGAVWIDGEWQWKGRRWVWQRGQWEVPYPGAYYAPSATVRLSDGTLAWFGGAWHFPGNR